MRQREGNQRAQSGDAWVRSPQRGGHTTLGAGEGSPGELERITMNNLDSSCDREKRWSTKLC